MGSREDSLESLKKFWPKKRLSVPFAEAVNKYKKEKIVIKCGGKVLTIRYYCIHL